MKNIHKLRWPAAALIIALLAMYALGFPPGGRQVEDKDLTYDGPAFTGNLIDGKSTGAGILVFHNGDIYEGAISNGRFDGHGIYTSADKWIYEGEFRDGVAEGWGVLKDLDGMVIYEGVFTEGLPLDNR